MPATTEMVKTRITVLVENTAHGPGLLAEHGLSYWIETNDRRILLDSGQGGVLAGNAYKLGIALGEIDALILSHGHYDHTGGVAEALKTDRPVTVYAHPAAFTRKFIRNNDGTAREIGMPYLSDKAIRDSRNRLIAITQPTTVLDGLTATGPVPRLTDFEDTGGPFFLDEACTRPDPLEDDQSVFFDTNEGTVALLGCAHSGVINTLRYIHQLTDNRPIRAVIGGMHLIGASPHRIERTVEELQRIGVKRLAPAHCTGMPATVALWNAFPGRCQPCSVGTRFEFD
jgi:7,8-dihydropterin-6-yl-methyl-4-(beta-D-ribofuranosyl)aminobenzene 5'-phosphate synthase